ncbi:hypothetical protein EV715DRAFT_290338 [Schizophyllum commune]
MAGEITEGASIWRLCTSTHHPPAMASPALIPGSMLSTDGALIADGVLIAAGPSYDGASPSARGYASSAHMYASPSARGDACLHAQLAAATLTDDAILALLACAEHTEEGEETTARGWCVVA